MNFLTALFYFFINGNFGEINLVKIAPSQSATFFNGDIFLSQPSNNTNEGNLNICILGSGNIDNGYCYIYGRMDGSLSDIFDYQFLNPSGSLKSQNSIFTFGSVRHSYLDKMHATVNSRFALITYTSHRTVKEEYRLMPEPSFSSFPDIEYSVSLIGNPDISKPASDAALYILGGAKYYSNNRKILMVNSFSTYSFSKGIWEDFSNKLPQNYEPVAGHKMINIDNEKLVILGGYRTNNYTYNFDGKITAANPEFSGFKRLLVFDLKEQRWEYKSTNLSEEDEKMLGTLKQYSCAAVHRKNKLYVYPGFYTESATSSIIHFFGVLDLNNWSWKWKKIQLVNMDFNNYPNTMNFDSLLFDKYMIISHSDAISNIFKKFIGFDLDKEDITTYIAFNNSGLQDLNMKKSTAYNGPYFSRFHGNVVPILWSVTAAVILIISYLLYRYYKYDRESKGYVPRYEIDQIWSDSDLKFYNNQNDFLYDEKTFNTNSGSNIEHFDNSFNINVLNFENEKDPFLNESTAYNFVCKCSQHSFQTIATLIQPTTSENTQFSHASGSTRKWDPYSTY